MTSTNCRYFIVTKKPRNFKSVNVGCLCYMTSHKYNAQQQQQQETTKHPKTLSVLVFGTRAHLEKDLEVSCLEELNLEDARLLLGVSEDAERLRMFYDQPAFQAVRSVTVGSAVTVEEDGKILRGIVRYIGKLSEPEYPYPISGTYYGIELLVGMSFVLFICIPDSCFTQGLQPIEEKLFCFKKVTAK